LLFLNRRKPKDRKDKLFLVNASQIVEKGDPKNFIPAAGIERIAISSSQRLLAGRAVSTAGPVPKRLSSASCDWDDSESLLRR